MRFGLLLAGVVAMLPFEAANAGVILNFRDIATSAANRGVESVVFTTSQQQGAGSGSAAASSSGQTTGTGKAPAGAPVPTPGNGGPFGDEALAGSIGSQAGAPVRFAAVDGTEDLGAAGCGGATAARGPIGLLPFVVAGLALLRRRR